MYPKCSPISGLTWFYAKILKGNEKLKVSIILGFTLRDISFLRVIFVGYLSFQVYYW